MGIDRSLKIALVSAFDYASLGGVNTHISNLSEQFRKSGHQVSIIAPCSDDTTVDETNFIPMGKPVPIPSSGSIARISLSVWLRPKIKSLLSEESFDIVHVHNPFSGMLPIHMLEFSKSINVATFHNYGTRLYRLGGKQLAMPSFRKLDGLIAVSEPARDYVAQHFPGKYEIIPNGISVEEFSEHVEPIETLNDGMINLLFLGRLEKRKGLKYLLTAYAKLKWDWPNLRLLIVGPGKPDEESYRIISEHNLRDVILVGPVSDKERVRYYASADIYCSPATGGESFGMVLLEAMAATKPVVATSIPGFSSVMTDGIQGLLVPPKDPESLAASISKLLSNPKLRHQLAHNGRKHVEYFRWSNVANRIMEVYTSKMDSHLQNTATNR
ncbi:MAG: glycosyltransferase family 4 protein [Anaerolineales bacterium]|nr:glycosyltransferase family 4 protein [Anaerolineales bacterium]